MVESAATSVEASSTTQHAKMSRKQRLAAEKAARIMGAAMGGSVEHQARRSVDLACR